MGQIIRRQLGFVFTSPEASWHYKKLVVQIISLILQECDIYIFPEKSYPIFFVSLFSVLALPRLEIRAHH